MSITKNDLARLVTLQEHDKVLDELKRQLAQVPADLAALRAEIAGEQSRLDEVHQKANRVELQKKEKELAMAEKEELIKKHQRELNSVKSNDAFKALLKEIEASKKLVGDLETEILLLMDEVDAVKKEERGVKELLKKIEADGAARARVLEARKTELEGQVAEAVARRTALLDGVPSELSALYEATKLRRAGVAMARAGGDTCTACNMKIMPQSMIYLTKGTQIVTCDSCQRILYIGDLAGAGKA